MLHSSQNKRWDEKRRIELKCKNENTRRTVSSKPKRDEHKPAKFIAQAQLIWSKRWFIAQAQKMMNLEHDQTHNMIHCTSPANPFFAFFIDQTQNMMKDRKPIKTEDQNSETKAIWIKPMWKKNQ